MSKGLVLVTGATGMVGRAVAERLLESGYAVRAMVRDPAHAEALDGLNVERFAADLAAPETLPPALHGVRKVVHAAAHVGDWGPAEQYRAINVIALEHFVIAARREPSFERWIQISSLGVYPGRDHHGTDETAEVDIQGLDGYTRTKAEAEVLLRKHMDEGFPAVILRPGFIYGPGDRHVLPRIMEKLRAGKMKLIGDGRKLLNNTYVGNLVEAVLLALENEAAVGEILNIRDARLVDRVEFVGTIADALGCPRPKHAPLGLARFATAFVEGFAKLRGRKTAPLLTRARLKFLTLNLDYSIAKAQRVLGYQGAIDFQEGMQAAVQHAMASSHHAPPK
jgi:nucleoside-diphosphate-sugar epimerase